MAPPPGPKVWQIVYMGCDGIQELGHRIEWYPPRDRRGKGKMITGTPMANLLRRLKKLEAVMTDDVGLVPRSPRWWAYWNEQLHKYIARDPDARNTKVPLEVLRAWIQSADPDLIEGDVEA
jgi:hypothetical protein